MKASTVRSLLILTLLITSSTKVFATCGDTQNQRSPETDSFHCFGHVTPITKAVHWKISWLDGYGRCHRSGTTRGRLVPFRLLSGVLAQL